MQVELKHVKRVTAKGKVYYYHTKTGERLNGDPSSQEFVNYVSKVNAKLEKAKSQAKAQGGDVNDRGTLGFLIRKYRLSPEYTQLAVATKQDYDEVFEWLKPVHGEPLISFNTPAVLKLRDKAFRERRRHFANMLRKVMSRLFNWGKPAGITSHNPADEVPAIPKPKNAPDANRPWTQSELRTVLDAMPLHLRAAVALGAFAGMREGDVRTVMRTAYDAGTRTLRYRMSKTGNVVETPVFSELAEILDAYQRHRDEQIAQRRASAAKRGKPAPVEYLNIIVGERGEPFTEAGFRASFFKIIRELRAAGRVEDGLTFHGLRHTAATMLAELGVPAHDIMALTGHTTLAMVQRYTARAQRAQGAARAVESMEAQRRGRGRPPKHQQPVQQTGTD